MMPFAATWVTLDSIILNEVSQKEKDKYQCYHLYVGSKIWDQWTYLWSRKRLTYLWSRKRLTDIEDRLVNAKGWWGGVGWEFGVSRCKLLHTEWINNKVLLHSTGMLLKTLWWLMWEINLKSGYMYMYNWFTLRHSRN